MEFQWNWKCIFIKFQIMIFTISLQITYLFEYQRRIKTKKLATKIMSLVLILSLSISMTMPAFTVGDDPYSIESRYVQGIIDLDEEQIKALSIEEAKVLFEKRFSVKSNNYIEDEIRLALDCLVFSLKFQEAMAEIKEVIETQLSSPFSTIGSAQYSGNIGVVWIRDTISGRSSLTLGEILSGTYTLEQVVQQRSPRLQ